MTASSGASSRRAAGQPGSAAGGRRQTAAATAFPHEGRATGREWRTPPLWGIGLTETVNSHIYFLHDGRARGLAETILWHGGEAEASRDAFRALPANDRAALLAFLAAL